MSLHVGNLPDDFSSTALTDLFEPFGSIDCVRLSQGRRYAFITFRRYVPPSSSLVIVPPLHCSGPDLILELF